MRIWQISASDTGLGEAGDGFEGYVRGVGWLLLQRLASTRAGSMAARMSVQS